MVPVGFVIKVAREGLIQIYRGEIESRLNKALGHLDTSYGGLFYMT